ncbi:MAG: HAD family hydrolase, partial [Pseudomonadota bacterium]
MAQVVQQIAFDADDTLWENEFFFKQTQNRFADLLSDYVSAPKLDQALLATERANINIYGYGIKGFILSMIETALAVSDRRADAALVQAILDMGKDMLNHPVVVLDGVSDTLAT